MSLRDRHSDILAARNIYELPVGSISIEENVCSLIVSDLLTVILVPNYPLPDDGSFYDWSTVGRVKLMRINDVE